MFWNVQIDLVVQSILHTTLDNPWVSPLLTLSQYRNGRKGPRREEIRSSQATATASVDQNGQPRGGGFTGGVSQSSGSRSTVHPAHRGREAELPQLQRSDTRWCCGFTFHLGIGGCQIGICLKRFGGGISLTRDRHIRSVLRMRDKGIFFHEYNMELTWIWGDFLQFNPYIQHISTKWRKGRKVEHQKEKKLCTFVLILTWIVSCF